MPQQHRRLLVFPNDALREYLVKGEVKERYFNPMDLFDEVHVLVLARRDVDAADVRALAGRARLTIHAIGKLRPWNPFSWWALRCRAREIVAAVQPSIIRGYNPIWHGALAVACGRALHIPVVLSLHIDYDELRWLPLRHAFGFFVRRPRMLVAHLLLALTSAVTERYCLTRATAVICVSQFLTRYAERHGARSPRVIFNRVSVAKFSRQTPLRSGIARPLRVLTVGRLDPQKQHDVLLRALVGCDAALTIIGDGPLRDALASLAERLGVANRVRWIASVPHRDIARHFWEADAYACASRFEGFGIGILEAMATGLPVVVADKEPMPEILGGTGIVVLRRSEAFRTAFVTLAGDGDLRRRLGAAATARATTLDGAVMEEREAAVYRSIMGSV